jgi:hypothetical protein
MSYAVDRPLEPGGSERKLVFVVGCPRSGTTWVQVLLAQHPAVATAPETQIFAYYLDHFLRQWRHERGGPGRDYQGNAGLSRLLSQEEFDELCRVTARFVLDKISAKNPAAGVVVEKSPKHALYVEWIQRIFPNAWFLHVVRDPRDTVASLLAAARDWGRGWAPKNAIEAARMWRAHVLAAQKGNGLTPHYRELQYETLQQRPVDEVRDLFAWLGIPLEQSACQAAVEACELERLRKETDGSTLPLPGSRSPSGFFRKGAVGGWQEELSATQVRLVEHLCGDLMERFGYERVTDSTSRPRLRVVLHDGIQRIRESVDWQLERLLYRI